KPVGASIETETPTAQPTASQTKKSASSTAAIWQQPTVAIGIFAVMIAAMAVLTYAFRKTE
ncbi:MAG: hypothetical protein ACOC5C_06685, partial [Halobacteriota archaeon]